MQIKIQKKYGHPFSVYSDKFQKFRRTAKIFCDGSGEFKISKYGWSSKREDGNLEDWISELQSEIDNLNVVCDFLKDIKHIRSNNKTNI